jgi:hypothetical protein
VAITQPHGGIFQQRYGSFAGKAAGEGAPESGPHNPGTITQPHAGIFQQRYGSFAGKQPGVGVPAAVVRSNPLRITVGQLMR